MASGAAKGLVKKHLGRRASLLSMAKSAAGKVAAAGANKAIDMASGAAKGLVKKHLGRRDSLLSMAKSAAGKVAAAGANKAIDMATAGAKGLVKARKKRLTFEHGQIRRWKGRCR